MGAVIEAFRALKKPCKVTLVTDSMICVYTLQSRNKKPKKRKNPDLVEKMLEVTSIHEVAIEWTRGHSGHEENEKCDLLASNALKTQSNPTPEYTMPPVTQPSSDVFGLNFDDTQNG